MKIKCTISNLEWHAHDKLCSEGSVEEFRCLERKRNSERKDDDPLDILRYICRRRREEYKYIPLVDLEKSTSEQFGNQPLLPTVFRTKSFRFLYYLTTTSWSTENVFLLLSKCTVLPLFVQVDHQSDAENQSNAYPFLQTVLNTKGCISIINSKL